MFVKVPYRVSSDRELAGKLNDAGKKWEMAGNFPKRRNIREFLFNCIIYEKEKLQSSFLPFFSRKKQNQFF